MDFGQVFWIFIVVIALQPMVSRWIMEHQRTTKLADIEATRSSRVILLMHRQETMSLLGFPMLRFIDLDDSEKVLRAISMTDPQVPVDVVLHTPGGLVIASLQIARALKDHPGKVTVFVPHYAMSGGTLIALAADEIVMTNHSVLGPIDPQIDGLPAASLIKLVEDKPISDVDDKTLVQADIGKKATAQLKAATAKLLEKHVEPDKALELAGVLTSGQWTHDYGITATEASGLGLNVNTQMPTEIFDLMELYPQPVRSIPSVEYLPFPHERETSDKRH